MGHVHVSKALGGMVAVAALLSVVGTVQAESRPEVLERIKPVGEVTIEGQAAPAAPVPATDTQVPVADTAAAPAPEATIAPAPAPAAAADSSDPAALAQAKGCLACHQVAVKVVGPAYKDVAAKYKGEAGALDMLVQKVKAGGVGTWGQIPMPPQMAATDEEIKTLVKWVLSQ